MRRQTSERLEEISCAILVPLTTTMACSMSRRTMRPRRWSVGCWPWGDGAPFAGFRTRVLTVSLMPRLCAKRAERTTHSTPPGCCGLITYVAKACATGTLKTMKKSLLGATVEIAFILFLFYANLLMGEFERSGMGRRRGLAWAVADVATSANFAIGMIAALAGYIVFEFLRKRF